MHKRVTGYILIVVLLNVNFIVANNDNTMNPFFNLILQPYSGSQLIEYALFVQENLKEINIDVEVKLPPMDIITQPFHDLFSDKDMFILRLSDRFTDGGKSPDMRKFFTKSGSLNIFQLDENIPYYNESENLQNEAIFETNLRRRQQLYYDWQILMMQRILPMFPLYAHKNYEALWANTLDYDTQWGLIESLPYMEYNGLHEGQESLNEFNVASETYKDLNPLFNDDYTDNLVLDLISEPIIQWSPDMIPLDTGLVYKWDKFDDNHFVFHLRDNIYWNPSYNVTQNDASTPLEDTPLMLGLKDGQSSNGTNQKVTAKDAVFTYLSFGNPLVSENSDNFEWISNCYVDINDSLAFHIEIDAEPNTIEREPYAFFWESLSIPILPEFFLNTSQTNVSLTTGGIECYGLYEGITNSPQWTDFSSSAFGCGKYMIHYLNYNVKAVLKRSPYWFGVGAKDGREGMIPFVNIVEVLIGIDLEEQVIEFKAGKLDIVDITRFPDTRKKMLEGPFSIHSSIGSSFSFLGFNLARNYVGGEENNIWLNEPGKTDYTKALAIRKAICYVIDREKIKQEILLISEDIIINSVMYPWNAYYYYDAITPKYDRNLDLAWEWMEAAGYKKPEIDRTDFPFNFLSFLLIIVLFLYKYRKRKKL